MIYSELLCEVFKISSAAALAMEGSIPSLMSESAHTKNRDTHRAHVSRVFTS